MLCSNLLGLFISGDLVGRYIMVYLCAYTMHQKLNNSNSINKQGKILQGFLPKLPSMVYFMQKSDLVTEMAIVRIQ